MYVKNNFSNQDIDRVTNISLVDFMRSQGFSFFQSRSLLKMQGARQPGRKAKRFVVLEL